MKDLLFLLISYEWIFLVMTTKFCIIFCWFEKHDLLVFNVCGFISFEVGYPLFCFTCMGSYSLAFLNFQFSKRVSGISNTLGLGIKFITSKLILIILGWIFFLYFVNHKLLGFLKCLNCILLLLMIINLFVTSVTKTQELLMFPAYLMHFILLVGCKAWYDHCHFPVLCMTYRDYNNSLDCFTMARSFLLTKIWHLF
jgi:hypothetical protein